MARSRSSRADIFAQMIIVIPRCAIAHRGMTSWISKPRDDIRQRRARAVFARLRWRADVNEAREFFVRLQSQSIEHVAIEREPARQPARAIAPPGRRGDDVHRTRAGG